MRTIPAGEFKARCLALMDEVAATGEVLVITKRGKPVARMLPPENVAPEEKQLFGSMRGKAEITGDILSPIFTEEEWESFFDEKFSDLGEDKTR